MVPKSLLITLISFSLAQDICPMDVALPAVKAIALNAIASHAISHVLSNQRVNQEILSVLQQLDLVSADPDLRSVKEQVIIYLVQQLAQKGLAGIAAQGVVKLDQICAISEQFSRIWQTSYPDSSLSETDIQRAVLYISMLIPAVSTAASLYELVTHVIAYQKEQDRKFRFGIECDPKAKHIYYATMTQAVIELLAFAINAHTISSWDPSGVKLNKIYFEPGKSGKFGRKFNKAVQAVNTICQSYAQARTKIYSGDVKSHTGIQKSAYTASRQQKSPVHEIEEVTLEFLKEISDNSKQYVNYLKQAQVAGLTRAQEYLETEHNESCFYELNGRLCKKLSPKWLTEWNPAYIRWGSKAIDTGNKNGELRYAVKLYSYPDDPYISELSSSNAHPIGHTHTGIDTSHISAVNHSLYDDLYMAYTEEQKAKRILDTLDKKTDREILHYYSFGLVRRADQYKTRLKATIKRADLRLLRTLVKKLDVTDFIEYYDRLDKKLQALPEQQKKLEQRLLRLGRNTKELQKLPDYLQQVVLEKIAHIEHELRIAKTCVQLIKLAPGSARDAKLLKYAKQAISSHSLRSTLNEQVPGFEHAVAQIMKNKLNSHGHENLPERKVLHLAFETEEIARSNFCFRQSLTGDFSKKYIELISKARLITSQHNFNFDSAVGIAQRFNLSASEIIAQNPHNYSAHTQHELLNTLDQLAHAKINSSRSEREFKSTVENLTEITVQAIADNNELRASLALTMLQKTGEFFCGVCSGIKQEIIETTQCFAAGKTAGTAITILAQKISHSAIRVASMPVAAGMFVCNLWGNNRHASELFHNFLAAWQTGDARKIGELRIKALAFSTDLKNSFTAVHQILKKLGRSHPAHTLIEEVKAGFSKAQKLNTQLQASCELHAQFTKTAVYKDLQAEAIKLGTSPQAWDRRVQDLCIKLSHADDVVLKLKEINNLMGLESIVIPKGLKKRIKLLFDHSTKFEFGADGKPKGWHFDEQDHLFKDKKIKVIACERESNGMYRAIIESNGKQKTSSFFCNKRNDSLNLHKQVLDALNNVDYSLLKPNKKGKFEIEIEFQGGMLKAQINAVTAEVHTFFPHHKNWTESLEKIFGQSKRS